MKVVSNSTPIISLATIGRIDLFSQIEKSPRTSRGIEALKDDKIRFRRVKTNLAEFS